MNIKFLSIIVGLIAATTTIFAQQPNINKQDSVITTELEGSTVFLQEVTVQARRVIQKADHEFHRVETAEPTLYIHHLLNTTVNYSLTEKDKYFFNARFRYGLDKYPYSANDRNSTLIMGNDTFAIHDHTSETNRIPALDLYFQRKLKNNQLLIFNVVGTQVISDYSCEYYETQAANSLTNLYSTISGNKY